MKLFSPRTLVMILVDAMLVNMGFCTALLLRFDGRIPRVYLENFLEMMPLITALVIVFLILFKLYNRIWEYASLSEMFSIILATSCSLGIIFVLSIGQVLPELPKTVYVMAWVGINAFVGVSRLWWRLFRDYFARANNSGRRVLIVGAGDAGVMLAREIQNNPHLGLEAVAFVDDDERKKAKLLLGLPIIGDTRKISMLVEKMHIDEIIIAMPSVALEVQKEIIAKCKQSSASLKILPDIYSSIDGSVMKRVRMVQMEDLLGRETTASDLDSICGYVQNRTVMVTGAGGSIGSELCRQLIRFQPRCLLLVDNCENNLFDIDNELQDLRTDTTVVPRLIDTRNRVRLEKTFNEYRPQVIFHAAAFKHVPMMEMHPEEALENNVIGTRNVAEMADRYQSEVFILISTDKAVNPTSVMGASKRMAELVIKDINRNSKTNYAAVRFGNVLGSRGSVIPTFMKQIEKGGPVTVTHPDMKRFFMTIPEAVQLVIQAGALARGGEIFVLDMGEQVRIADLAHDLIKLSGYRPGVDIEIAYSGIRPGEKMYEELFSGREEMAATRHERIFISQKELDDKYSGINSRIVAQIRKAVVDRSEVIELISTLLPEYQGKAAGNEGPGQGELIYLPRRVKK